MKSAASIINDQQRQAVNAAVADAESKTSAEIIPVVASVSGRYDRAEDLAGLTLAAVALSVAWIAFRQPSHAPGDWGTYLTLSLAGMLAILLGSFVLGALLAAKISWLRKLLTSKAEMAAEVNARARQMFVDQRVHHTKGNAGLLLYVSLHERIAVVLADQAAAAALGDETVDRLCSHLSSRLHAVEISAALVETIKMAALKLEKSLPCSAADANELPDALILID